MRTLSKALNQVFKPARRPDIYKKSRDQSKKLAQAHGILIEPMKPGYNVWPPKSLMDSPNDPFDGDHYANDWDEVLERVKKYVEVTAQPN